MSDPTAELGKEAGSDEPENESGKMSFLEHLDELRKRLVHIIAYLFGGFIVCVFFTKQIYDFLAAPLAKNLPPGQKLIYLEITTPFLVYMKVAFLAAIFLTIPLTLYEVWKFIAPGLYRREKRYVIPFLMSSIILFFLGGAFCYIFVLPTTFKILLALGASFTPQIRIDGYLDLTNMMILGFGLTFEMPVIAAFLSLFGLVSAGFLWRKFKYAVVAIVVLAAILSPTGDAISLVIWSAPMVFLYFVSIGVAYLCGRSRKKAKEST